MTERFRNNQILLQIQFKRRKCSNRHLERKQILILQSNKYQL